MVYNCLNKIIKIVKVVFVLLPRLLFPNPS